MPRQLISDTHEWIKEILPTVQCLSSNCPDGREFGS